MSEFSIDNLWRYTLVYGFILLSFCFEFIDFSISFLGDIRPYYGLIPLYFWAIYRPEIFPPFLIFLTGVLYDLILGFPIALHALLFLTVYIVNKRQRLFLLGQSYYALWIVFCLNCLFLAISEYLFFSIYLGELFSVYPSLGNIILSVLFYPVATIFMNGLNNILPHASQTDFIGD